MSEVRLSRIGTAVPPHALDQATFTQWACDVAAWPERLQRLIPILFRRAGVERRHSVLLEGDPLRQTFFAPARDPDDRGPGTAARMDRYRAAAPLLAIEAARKALGDDRDVTHLVTVSCSGFHAPGVDVALIDALELPTTSQRTHVGFMGCHGAINGLRVADAIVRADPRARVLLCAVELCSLHYDYRAEVDPIVANSLFADGAAAALIEAGTEPNWSIEATGSCLWPSTRDAMAWRIGDHGFEMSLSPAVPDAIARELASWIDPWLAGVGVERSAVRSWAVHPGGPRILTAVEQALELPQSTLAVSRDVLAKRGNMSSPTVLFILKQLRAAQAPLPCVALAFGPGLAVESVLLT